MSKSKPVLAVLGLIVVFWFAWGTGQRVGATPAITPSLDKLYYVSINVHQDSKGKGPFESLICITPIVDIPGASISFSWVEAIEIKEAPKPFYGTLKEDEDTKWLINGVVKGPVDIDRGEKFPTKIRMHIKFPYPYKSVYSYIMNHHDKSKKFWGPFSQQTFERYLERYKGRVMKYTKTWSP